MHRRFLSCFIVAGFLCNATQVFADAPFADMENSWYRYKEAVQYLKDKDILGGYDDGTFKPKATINRAELLKIVFKGRSDVVPISRRCFSDVRPNEWYAPYVCAAKNRGIVSGYKNGTFKPAEPVNTAEAIKIVLNAYGHEVSEGTGAAWYLPYAQELEKLEILPQHSYIPWAPLTRERAADLLWRMLRHDEDRFVPRLSPGCGKAPPLLAPVTVDTAGVTRNFLLTVPGGYSLHDPAPLVVAFHGRTNSNEQVRQYMRLDRELTGSFIVYPEANSNGKGSYFYSIPGDDLKFFDAIVEKIAETYCIDMDRISVVGHSLGAYMANSVACLRGGVVMASATVGGDGISGTCAGPSAAMIIHNPKDNLSPFAGAERIRKQRIEANACAWETENTGPSELNCVRHEECAGGNDILWCPHTIDTDERGVFYPHTWPRNTSKYINEFFRSIH